MDGNYYSSVNRLNKLTRDPVLPAGWHKAGPGLWRHDNGEESRINPSSMITNSNFASLKSADDTVDVSAEYLSSHRATSNDSIKSASTGAGGSQQAPSPKGGAAEWYYMATDNSQRGPVNSEVLSRLFDRGEVRSNTYVWSSSECPSWLPLNKAPLIYVPAPAAAAEPAPPPPPPPPMRVQPAAAPPPPPAAPRPQPSTALAAPPPPPPAAPLPPRPHGGLANAAALHLPSTRTIGAPPSELHAPTVRAVIDFLADKQRQLEITGAGVEERLAAYTAGLHELLPTHAGTAAWVRHPGQAL
jgi:hypothetical protein